ncbi:hypothetical protein [Halalkaliarchaeum sp. AArc-CO]|uniref:hypothetical protein n=1 Tax=Halalkaliarchaeum sp. AArc-CO TaxID=2866381 RepID=UPI00217D2515|nr:hypothetical protein [Halalkaliarchaeum sp. AArc-CO]
MCEEVHYNLEDPNLVKRIVGKRSVFTDEEIKQQAESGTNVFLFRWHFDLNDFLSYKNLLNNDVLTGPLQVMRRIDEEDYKYIKEQGGIDGRFTLD